MKCWFANSLVRHFPTSLPGVRRTFTLDVARGERVSFQCAFRTDGQALEVEASAEATALEVEIRRVGYVPVLHLTPDVPRDELDGVGHIPGLVPDPLLPGSTIHAGPYETNSFWITIKVPQDISPGTYPVKLVLRSETGATDELSACVQVGRAVLSPRRGFPVTHWFCADALCDWYKVAPFGDSFWPLLEKYLANLVLHHTNTSHLPLFTPATDGVKRPMQLLAVSRDKERYRFDWSLVQKWVKLAKQQGIAHFEWPHFATQAGARHAVRIYEGRGEGERLLWDPDTRPTAPAYRTFLEQLLPEFRRFLEAEDLLETSFFHLSDEPHGDEAWESYRAARRMLHELAPWLRVMDAVYDASFPREDAPDVLVAAISLAPDLAREGYPAWCYFCNNPRGRHAQRYLDTPLLKTRLFGWLCYRMKAMGFLHWGYNYWYEMGTRQIIDPYLHTDALRWPAIPSGDPFVVYPGEDGPVDSIRWEVFAEGLQDYALLQTAEVSPGDELLRQIQSYAEFPRDPAWLTDTRSEVLRRLSQGASGSHSRGKA